MRTNKVVGLLGLTALLLALAGSPGPARAQTATDDGGPRPAGGVVERPPAVASFEGRLIDLSQDWGEARACLVWRQGGVLECFRTAEALDAREAELSPGGSPESSTEVSIAASWSCSSSLRLYEHNWYGERQLSFWDRGFWQNLGDYGFDNRTSSYIVGACYVHLAEHAHGGGWWYPGPTYPYAGEPVMTSSWQDRVSSIYIE